MSWPPLWNLLKCLYANAIRGGVPMTGGEAIYLAGVIAVFVVFGAGLAYAQIKSGGRKR